MSTTGELTAVPFDKTQIRSVYGCVTLPCGALLVTCDNTHAVYAVHSTDGTTKRVAGTGSVGFVNGNALTEAKFNTPRGMCVLESENCVLIAEFGNHAIR